MSPTRCRMTTRPRLARAFCGSPGPRDRQAPGGVRRSLGDEGSEGGEGGFEVLESAGGVIELDEGSAHPLVADSDVAPELGVVGRFREERLADFQRALEPLHGLRGIAEREVRIADVA